MGKKITILLDAITALALIAVAILVLRAPEEKPSKSAEKVAKEPNETVVTTPKEPYEPAENSVEKIDWPDIFVGEEEFIVSPERVETAISPQKAVEIAAQEAKKEKYWYQGWVSDFRPGEEDDENYYKSCVQLLHPPAHYPLGRSWWETGEFHGQLTWSVRLFDEHDPLTSLFIYVDAETGDILGAKDLSD